MGDTAYVARPNLEAALAGFVARGENLVLYGPTHQGKTMLLTRQMPSDTVVIECRPDFKRAQIYRVIMSSLGYAVLVEKKKSGKASTTVKLGVGVFKGEANAEGGLEQTLQPVTVDLKNSSEVAILISRIKNLPWIVLNNFQLLDSRTKRTLLFDLVTFADRPGMRILIVGSWPNEDYLEELEPALAGRFRYLEVPMWTEDELRKATAQWTSNARKPHAGDIEEFLDCSCDQLPHLWCCQHWRLYFFPAAFPGSRTSVRKSLSGTPLTGKTCLHCRWPIITITAPTPVLTPQAPNVGAAWKALP